MKRIKTVILILLLGASAQVNLFAQGCIAVRPMGTSSSFAQFKQQSHSKIQVTMNYRFLHSYKHFVGTDEQKQRVEQKNNVINDQHSFDLGITYQLSPRWLLTANLPVSVNDRSSLYEHYGNDIKANPTQARFHTQSQGIGDARLSASYWIINPAKLTKFNMLAGAGIKLPTGNSNVQDDFHKLTKEGQDYTIRKAVDQSIQLGDGGVGYSAEVQGFWQIRKNTVLYFNGFYLFSPKGVNSTPLSVPDQFAARAGLSQALPFIPGLSVLLGGRLEGIPAYDAFGPKEGSRRPGYIVSVEPGISYVKHTYAFSATVPVALVRNRFGVTPTFRTLLVKRTVMPLLPIISCRSPCRAGFNHLTAMPHIPLPEHLPGITGLLEYRLDTGLPIRELTQLLLRGESTLSPGERELIAVVVSARNHTDFCEAAHTKAADLLLGDLETAQRVKQDIDTAPVSEKLKALLSIAALTQTSGKAVTPDAIGRARNAGSTDREIHDTVLIAALFCLYNKYVDGLASVTPTDSAFYDVLGHRIANRGYGRPPGGLPANV